MKIIEDIKIKRKELNLNTNEIAEKLHLQETYIKYIESEEFDKFPDKIYLYGYIVRYLKLLNKKVKEYKEELEKIKKLQEEQIEEKEGKKRDNKKIYFIFIVVVFIVIIISLLFLIEKKEIKKEEIKVSVKEENIREETEENKKIEIPKNEIKIVSKKKTNVKYQADTEAIETKLFNADDSMVLNFYNRAKVNLENVWDAGIIVNDTFAQLGSFKNKRNINLEFFADTETKKIKWRAIENF
ncbi:MAG TPA: helix-turn-helix domain-containing protein [bacterium]|nr:helix-turn-helix domain-containing protein [bacterium]